MKITILIDFGSTFTKMAVVDTETQHLLFTTKTVSTVQTDASIGLEQCLEQAKKNLGERVVSRSTRLACSSAAGGLRMVVIGLTPTLSMLAGKNAALGAGARVIKSYANFLSRDDISEINTFNPEIILLCGGTDGGDVARVIRNASLLADHLDGHATVVFAGNQEAADDVGLLFRNANKECLNAQNIYPDLNSLNAGPAAEVIRNVFMKRIVNMKGLDKVRQKVGDIIMPTPLAVLKAGNLLAQGSGAEAGLGDLIIIDIGGATTDVHSFCAGRDESGVRLSGAPEPYAKRTVEGDLGLRSSAGSLWDEIDEAIVEEELGKAKGDLLPAIRRRTGDHSFLPDSSDEQSFDSLLSLCATGLAARRHAGRRFSGYCGGAQTIQQGKDLKTVNHIIGTGGPIINNESPARILKAILADPGREQGVLLPEQAEIMIDQHYILFAMGLLSHVDPLCALGVLKNSLKPLGKYQIC